MYVLERVRGSATFSKCLHFEFFQISVEGEGQFSNSPQIQISLHYPGGQENYGFFLGGGWVGVGGLIG